MDYLTLYHNTSNDNAIKISKEGIKGGLRLQAYGKGSEAEGSGIWCTTIRGYGYGGATITFTIDVNDPNIVKQNDTEYIIYRNITPNEIIDIDLVVSNIPCTSSHNTTVESDIPQGIEKWGKDKLLKVFKNNDNKFVNPYNYDKLVNLIKTGNKYCKGKIVIKGELQEGIHLVADVQSNDNSHTQTLESNNYNSKEDFTNYLTSNNYKVISVKDNRDLYVAKNSEYDKLSQLEKYINVYKKLCNKLDKNSSGYTMIEDVYLKLQKLYDEAVKQPLNESFEYMNVEDKPRYNDYIGLSMQIDGTKNKIKQLNSKLNKAQYDSDRNKYEYLINYYKQLLHQYELAYKDTGHKLNEDKHRLEEVSRNEMLAVSKAQTITRYKKSASYKGFRIYDIDTNSVLTTDALRVTCKVGKYWDTIEMQNILYWVQLYAEQQPDNQVNTKVVTKAIMDAVDAMDIKVDCTCPDLKYRFAYKLTKMGAKYGNQENRPAKIRNPNDFGYLCKHLIAMLSNKKWLQQVSGTLMDFIEKRIVEVNRYLNTKPGEELTLPNELARQNAKKGFYTKLFNTLPEEDENTDAKNEQ